MTDTLVERVDRLVHADKTLLLSSSPTSVAIQELLVRTEALEQAIQEIALEVQKLSP